MTVLSLTDFLSVMVENKRESKFKISSEQIFSNDYILKFLDYHFDLAVPEEVIKIFILQRRFRLSLLFIQKSKIQF